MNSEIHDEHPLEMCVTHLSFRHVLGGRWGASSGVEEGASGAVEKEVEGVDGRRARQRDNDDLFVPSDGRVQGGGGCAG